VTSFTTALPVHFISKTMKVRGHDNERKIDISHLRMK